VVHEHAHPDDREGLVLFAPAILPQVICFLYFKEKVRAVVIEDILSAFNDSMAVLIEPGLDKVVLGREDAERTVDVVELEGRLLYKEGSLLI
jgi:hypothetical protein